MITSQQLEKLETADALVVVGAVDGVAGVDGDHLDAAPEAAAPALVVGARRSPRPHQHPPPAGGRHYLRLFCQKKDSSRRRRAFCSGSAYDDATCSDDSIARMHRRWVR
jgi:hypothetical protein